MVFRATGASALLVRSFTEDDVFIDDAGLVIARTREVAHVFREVNVGEVVTGGSVVVFKAHRGHRLAFIDEVWLGMVQVLLSCIKSRLPLFVTSFDLLLPTLLLVHLMAF